jgi:hypothetical protein
VEILSQNLMRSANQLGSGIILSQSLTDLLNSGKAEELGFRENEYTTLEFGPARERLMGNGILKLLPPLIADKLNPTELGKTVLNVLNKNHPKDAKAKMLLGRALGDLVNCHSNVDLKNLKKFYGNNFLKLIKALNPNTVLKNVFKPKKSIYTATGYTK